MAEKAPSVNLEPLVIEGDGRWVLAPDEAAARRVADAYWSLDECVLTPDGWFHNIGWDRDGYESRAQFERESGYDSWWESCQPPQDGQPTRNAMPAWQVTFR